jgi:V/A-type H+-transporting ATPase subunit D
MAKKIRLTRPELKRQRDALQRYERYLPMLKLKQQQLQLTMRDVRANRRKAIADAEAALNVFQPYRAVLSDRAGINVSELSEPSEVRTSQTNVAGVSIPVFEEALFPRAEYSLFATPAWVDRTIADLRTLNEHRARAKVFEEQYRLLDRELTKIIQRVNLFEKVKIPECREVIRVIRIKLGDEMTAAVGRGKIAKAKIAEASNRFDTDPSDAPAEAGKAS